MLYAGSVYAQKTDTLKKGDTAVTLTSLEVYVNDIVIAGNDITDDDIILREMDTKKGRKLDVLVLERDMQRVYNLNLFTKVDVIPVPVDTNKVNLVITVEESFYLIPIPQGGIKEGDLSKIWGGLNVRWRNFRGRNETLGLSFGVGYEPFVSASYFNPWVGDKAHFFTSASVKYSKDVNKSINQFNTEPGVIINRDSVPDYYIYNFDAGLTVGKYLSQPFSVSAGIEYNIIELSEYQPGRTLSPDGKDNFVSAVLAAKYDTRDLSSYTTFGSYYDLKYLKHGIYNKHHDFNRIKFDFRRFIPIKLGNDYAVTFAARTLGTISFGGNIPSYMLESFGYGDLIRGWDDFVFSGENQLAGYTELRIPVIKPFYVSGTRLPIVKKISLLKNISYKFGLYATAFFDVGGVWNKKDAFQKTQFKNGYGVGLNAILPFNFVGRVDFALSREDERLTTHFIFALNSSF
jgi:outer membrane protein assembly factor BamA